MSTPIKIFFVDDGATGLLQHDEREEEGGGGDRGRMDQNKGDHDKGEEEGGNCDN